MADFAWPWQYSFPPFYTIQPNSETRRVQMTSWCQLILDYCRHSRHFSISVSDAPRSPLFHNAKIKRGLSEDDIRLVLDEMVSSGKAQWTDKSKISCDILWRSVEEWASMIYNWVSQQGMTGGSVCTLYELISGDDTAHQEFHGIPEDLAIRALKSLQIKGKAELMSQDGNVEGVKFF